MKKILWAAFLLTLVSVFAARTVHAQAVPLFGGSGITASGSYGVNGATSFTDATNWVDCTAYECDGRVFSVGGTGSTIVTFECKSQLTDTDEPPYPCYGPVTIDNATFTYGYFPTLARAEFYRATFSNMASGTWKAFVVKKGHR